MAPKLSGSGTLTDRWSQHEWRILSWPPLISAISSRRCLIPRTSCARTPAAAHAGRPGQGHGLRDRTRIERLSRGAQSVTADTALRLARVFNTSAQFWINLQTAHDLSAAAIESREELAKVEPLPGFA